MVKEDEIESLVALAKAHGLIELTVQSDKNKSISIKLPSVELQSIAPHTQAPQSNPIAEQNCVCSPMVGTVYLCPKPGEPPYVTAGKKVNKGDVLCLIEAMKMFNKVLADRDGTIQSILVDDASGVAFDTPLFSWRD